MGTISKTGLKQLVLCDGGNLIAVAGVTGNILSTDALMTGMSSTTGLVAGMKIVKTAGTGALTGTPTIVSVDSASQVTMSAVAATSGTLTATFGGPTVPIAMGIRGPAFLKHGNYKPIKDYLNRTWRNRINFKVEAETYQPTMRTLAYLVSWLNGGCDAQILTNKQSGTAGSEDVFQFYKANDSNLGLEFELMYNADKRSIKTILEGAINYTAAQTLIDAADSVTEVAFSGITGAGDSETYLRRPAYAAFEAPKGTSIVVRDEIVERSYSIKTKGKKSVETNMLIVDYLTFEIIMKFRNASIANQIAIMAKDNAPSLYIKELNAGAYYDAWDFAAGVITLDPETEINDEDRIQTLKFVADVPLFDVAFEFGAAKGGTADDAGTLGGTMVIS